MHSSREVSAVSPIISTILLIGICTVFASVMFVWVNGFVLQSGYVPAGELAIMERNNPTTNVTNYTILIKVLRPGTAPQDIKCYICDKDGISRASAIFPTTPGSKEPFSGTLTGNITWKYDSGDGRVSSYDIINISIDKDETFLEGYSFYLRHPPTGGNLIAAVGLI